MKLQALVFLFCTTTAGTGSDALILDKGQGTFRPSFKQFADAFAREYATLNLPGFTLDYREYFKSIPEPSQLDTQEQFFNQIKAGLEGYKRADLPATDRITWDHLNYEIEFNLQRIALEKSWVADGRVIPEGGLHGLKNYADWYRFFIRKFTSLDMSPEDVNALGEREVRRVQMEIKKIQTTLGFKNAASFYKYLNSDTFYIKDKVQLVNLFEKTDKTIRQNLPEFIGKVVVPEVIPLEWEGAGPNTPPGIYMSHTDNNLGKDAFKFNFYGGRYNRRAVEWLYMHEAIPGHHLQSSLRRFTLTDSLQNLFFYAGNAEGWGCYVEYEGKTLGMYQDLYSYLGKWEWDLVRSARLVMDCGVHYYGWTHEQALAYWRSTVPNQEDIAEREVTRVTNWTAQALSYKAGADCISKLKAKMQTKRGKTFDQKRFHQAYLSFGMRPLEVVKANFEELYGAE